MTELEQYCTKLYNALTESNPLLMLRKTRNAALFGVTAAEANSILTEAAKYNTKLAVTNAVITSAVESNTQARILSYMCLKQLSALYRHTYAFRQGLINERCEVIEALDKSAQTKLTKLSKFLKENVAPLVHALNITESIMVKQHIMRKIINALDKVQ